MTNPVTDIQAPVVKSATALASGAGASATSYVVKSTSFLPTDLAGWMAVAASAIAVIYTAHLLGEWYWKKFWKSRRQSQSAK